MCEIKEINNDFILLEAKKISSNVLTEIEITNQELIELLGRYGDRQFEKIVQENKKSKLNKKYKKQILNLIDKKVISKKDLKLMKKAAKKEAEIFYKDNND